MKLHQYLNKIRKNFLRISVFLSFALLLSFFPAPNKYFDPVSGIFSGFHFTKIPLPEPPLIPVNATGINAPPVSAEGIYIVDLPSEVTLYEKNPAEKLSPASTTKIATALVGLDTFKLDDVLTVRTVIKEGKTMGLVQGEKITFESLLYGALVHSANDAAFTIAENYPEGADKFISQMNSKAKSYHLDNTFFTNPIGFDDPKQYTTAYDLGKLAKIALANKIFSKIVSTKAITVSDVNFTIFHDLKNVNELLGRVAGVAGVKTGFTQNAGEILVTEVKKNSHSVMFVVLKSQDRFGETEKLIDWVFGNFIWKKVASVTPAIP